MVANRKQIILFGPVSHFAFQSWVLEFWQFYMATFGAEEVANHIQKHKCQNN
jgi:hypothetical protein